MYYCAFVECKVEGNWLAIARCCHEPMGGDGDGALAAHAKELLLAQRKKGGETLGKASFLIQRAFPSPLFAIAHCCEKISSSSSHSMERAEAKARREGRKEPEKKKEVPQSKEQEREAAPPRAIAREAASNGTL